MLSHDIVVKALLERQAARQPTREFAVFPAHNDLRWSWQEADQAANAAGFFLREAGVSRGDAVGLLLDSGPDYLRFAFGVLKLGAVIAPLNPAFVGNTLAHAVNLTRARVLVCDTTCLTRLEPSALPHLQVIVVSGGLSAAEAVRLGRTWTLIQADTVPLRQSQPPAVDPLHQWDPYAIIFTSGTTGPSKGVLAPYGQLHACVEDNFLAWMTDDDVYLLDAPLFHVTGLIGLYAALAVGAKLVVLPRFDVHGYWSRVRKYGVTTTAFVLAVLDKLYRQPSEPADAENPLRLLLSGPLPSYTRDWQQRFGVDVIFSYYNMTELSPVITTEPNPAANSGAGRLRPGYEARIVDDHDEELPDGEVGQLIVRSDRPWRFSLGYFGMPEATVEAWRNGWFHTGDMFRRDASGEYYFVDRQRDRIRRKGENISSFEVEREILSHPDILECAVVGVADPETGDTEVKAVIVPEPGRLLDPRAVFGYLVGRLPRFMLPRFIEVSAALPRNSVGRVTKNELRSAGVTDSTWDRRSQLANSTPSRPASFYEYAQLLDRAAVIEADGQVIDYLALGHRVNQVSHALRAAGVGPGDKISGLLGNTSRFFEIELGAAQIGVHFVAVNTHLTAAEIAYIVGNSGSRLVFADAEFLSQATAALDAIGNSAAGLIAIDGPPGYRSYAEFVGGHSSSRPEDRVYAMRSMYTSGTTGRPKGVVWPIDTQVDPEHAVAGVDWIMAQRGMVHDPTAVTLISGPLFHGAPGSWATAALHRGHTVVLSAKWDSERFLRTVERYHVTTAQLAPVHFFRLLQLPKAVRDRFDVSSLRVISHAGAATPIETKRQMIDWMGPILYEYYGSSEGWGTTISSQDWLAHPGSVGRHDGEGARMKILDDNGAELPPGVPGILWVRNPTGVNSEYLDDPDATAANRSGEYYTVGDIAYLDEDGWLFIVDRRTDLILSGAVNVYPAEVEDVLRQHPAVSDVAVVGVTDPEWGQRVCAVIVPLPGHGAGSDLAADVQSFARSRLAGYKVPKQIVLRESLPYSPVGKLLRREVRAELEALAADSKAEGRPLSPHPSAD